LVAGIFLWHAGPATGYPCQKPEARSQKPEARSQKPEARSQAIEVEGATEGTGNKFMWKLIQFFSDFCHLTSDD
jgi:hypothetical protein